MTNFPKGKNWKNKAMICYKHWSRCSVYFQKTFVEMKSRIGQDRNRIGAVEKITQLT